MFEQTPVRSLAEMSWAAIGALEIATGNEVNKFG